MSDCKVTKKTSPSLLRSLTDLINSEVLSVCKKGVKFVNVARGGIIDEKALLDSLNANHCGGAALDVFEEEPPTNLKLIQHPGVICTPHLGANTREAQKRVAVELAQQIIDFKQGHSLIGVVNGSAVTSQLGQGNRPILLLSKRLGQIIGASSTSTPTHISLSFNRERILINVLLANSILVLFQIRFQVIYLKHFPFTSPMVICMHKAIHARTSSTLVIYSKLK